MDERERERGAFRYTYAAPTAAEREEIESIRQSYLPAETRSGTEELRRLHARARRVPAAASLCAGIAGILTMGGGMALSLEGGQPGWGIALSLLGIAVAALAYPLHRLLARRAKKKYGPRILALCDALLPGEEGTRKQSGPRE